MDQVKINQVRWPEEDQYLGGIYPAFKMEFDDGYCEYAAQVAEDRLAFFTQGACKVIEEDIPALKVKVLKTNLGCEEWCVGNIYEAFKMVHPDRTDYAVHVRKDLILDVDPENVEVIENTSVAIQEKTVPSTNKILLVEDGSVDVDDLEEWCANNGIKLVVYRQGANKPEFLEY